MECDDDDDDDDEGRKKKDGEKTKKGSSVVEAMEKRHIHRRRRSGQSGACRRAPPPPTPPSSPHSPLRHHLAESTPILIDAEPHERLLLHPPRGGAVARLLFLTGMGDVPVFSLHDIGVGDPI